MTRLLLLLLALALRPALAAATPPEDLVRAEILPGWQDGEGRHVAGLRLTMAPGWKTYWRAPGDAGIPPEFDWTGSHGVAGVEVRWPVPQVFDQSGMKSIGYHDEVVLPLEIRTTGAGPVRLAGEIDLGICHEICVPARLAFSLDLPDPGARDREIVAALLDTPLTGAEAGMGAATCRLRSTARGVEITAELDLPPQGADETVAIEAGLPGIWVSEAEVTRTGDRLTARAEARAESGALMLDRSALRLTVIGAGRAVEVTGCPAG